MTAININRIAQVMCMSLLVLCLEGSAVGFEPPGREQRLRAIGGTEGLPEVLKKAIKQLEIDPHNAYLTQIRGLPYKISLQVVKFLDVILLAVLNKDASLIHHILNLLVQHQ